MPSSPKPLSSSCSEQFTSLPEHPSWLVSNPRRASSSASGKTVKGRVPGSTTPEKGRGTSEVRPDLTAMLAMQLLASLLLELVSLLVL